MLDGVIVDRRELIAIMRDEDESRPRRDEPPGVLEVPLSPVEECVDQEAGEEVDEVDELGDDDGADEGHEEEGDVWDERHLPYSAV